MSLREKAWLSIVSLLTVGVLVYYSMSSAALLAGFTEIEEEAVRNDVWRFRAAMADAVAQLDRLVHDWASWDDTYRFIQDGNARYIRANLPEEALAALRINAIAFISTGGELVHAAGYDLEAEHGTAPPEGLLAFLKEPDCLLLKELGTSGSVGGVMLFPEGPMLVVARPILTSSDEGPARGAVVMARYVDRAEVERLARQTRVSATVWRRDDPALPPDFRDAQEHISDNAIPFIRAWSPDRISAYSFLSDLYGQPVLLWRADMKRPILAQATTTLQHHIVWLLAIGIAISVLALWVGEVMVLRRLSRLDTSLKSIGVTRDISARVPVEGSDEIAAVAGAINGMLRSLQQAERDRRGAEERYGSFMDATTDLVYLKDDRCRYLQANRAGAAFFGKRVEEMGGKNDFELMPEEAARRCQETDRKALETGGLVVSLEQVGDRVYETNKFPLRLGGGKTGVGMVIRDITERRRIETALQESERRLRAVVYGSPIPQFVISRDHKVLYWNKALEEITGVKEEDIIGSAEYWCAFYPEKRPCMADLIVEARVDAIPQWYRGKASTSKLIAGAYEVTDFLPMLGRWLYFTAAPVRDARGNIIGAVETLEDVTEGKKRESDMQALAEHLRKLTTRLQQIREEEGRRIARRIHDELGQGLTALKMDVAWLERRVPAADPSLREKTGAMKTMIDGIVQTVQRVSMELRPSILDDLGLASAVEWYVREFGERTGIKSSLSIDRPDLAPDPETATAVFRILQEALTNVARHAGATQTEARLAASGEFLEMTIRDNGKGISEAAARSPHSMGLIQMRERAISRGGTLEVKGSPGMGTELRLRVPLAMKS